MTSTSKRCSQCNVTKPLASFNRDTRRPDGRRYECADCTRINQTAARGGYTSAARAFVNNFRSAIDSFAVVDTELGRTPPPTRKTLPADLAVGRVVAVTDTLLAGLLGGDPVARAEAERILGAGK